LAPSKCSVLHRSTTAGPPPSITVSVVLDRYREGEVAHHPFPPVRRSHDRAHALGLLQDGRHACVAVGLESREGGGDVRLPTHRGGELVRVLQDELMRLFGITSHTAIHHVRAAYPECFTIDPTQA
jgi:hypothetical protein